MIGHDRIIEIVCEVATANLAARNVDRVLSEPTIDSEGREALKITIVLRPEAVPELKGDSVLDTLIKVQDRLRDAGEERFPILEYATQDELEASGDS